MNKNKKALKTISYFVYAVVLVLFLAFILTYDFKQNRNYSYDDLTEYELSNEFDELINQSILNSYPLNIIDLNINEELLNKIFHQSMPKDESSPFLYDSKYWTLKGFDLEIVDNSKIVALFYVKFHDAIVYDMRLKAYFSFRQSNDYFSFSLDKLKIGSVVIPKSIIYNALSKKEENTLGSIIKEAMKKIPFGTYDSNNLSFTIYKKEILNSMESGYLGDLISKRSKSLKTVLLPFTHVLLNNNLVSFSLDKTGFNARLNYSLLLNSDETVSLLKNKSAGASNKESLYKDCLMGLLNFEPITLSSADINYIFKKSIKNEFFESTSDYMYIDSLFLRPHQELLLVDCIFKIKNRYMVITLEVNMRGEIGDISIGADADERLTSYLNIRDTDSRIYIIRCLNELGFKANYITQKVELLNIFSDVGIDLNTLRLLEDKAIITFNDVEDLSETLLSDEFNAPLNGLVDYTTKENLIDSFIGLSKEDKETYLNYLKTTFENDLKVYNYICGFLN